MTDARTYNKAYTPMLADMDTRTAIIEALGIPLPPNQSLHTYEQALAGYRGCRVQDVPYWAQELTLAARHEHKAGL